MKKTDLIYAKEAIEDAAFRALCCIQNTVHQPNIASDRLLARVIGILDLFFVLDDTWGEDGDEDGSED